MFSKRCRSTPLASLEPTMHRFVELCVDMRKGRTAKGELMQYKNIAQNNKGASVQSIEAVITRFVQLAGQKVREAQEKAAVRVAVDVDDLEASKTPESILPGAVSGDQSKDRTDRPRVTPWLKFLWESYRTSLKTLKNNAQLEVIYQPSNSASSTTGAAKSSSAAFTRPSAYISPMSHSPPTPPRHALRAAQHLRRARALVGGIPLRGERAQPPHPRRRGRQSRHGAGSSSRRRRLLTGKTQPPSAEDAARFAGQVLISALAVPVGLLSPSSSSQNTSGSSSSNADPAATRLTALLGLPKPPTRLTALLGLSKPPTRASLLANALVRDVLRRAPKVVTQLYTVLEVEFDPLILCERSEVHSVYSYIMGCASRGELSVRIDHAAGSIAFVDALEGSAAAAAAPGEKDKTDAAVQPSVAELVRTRLGSVHNAIEAIAPPPPPPLQQTKMTTLPANFALLAADVQKERKALQLRRASVTRQRELLSDLSRAESSRREKEDEAKRAKEEAHRRELERVRKIQVHMKLQDTERYKAALAQLASLDTEGLIGMQVAQLEKEKKELSERLRIVAKGVDRIERAYRKDERLLLAQDYEQQQTTDRETFAAIQTQCKEGARLAHEEDLETKKRLARMLPDYEKRRVVVIAKKGEEYAKRKDAASRKIEREKAKRRKAPIVPNPLSGVRAPAAAPTMEGGGGSGTPAPSTPVTPTRATLASSTPPRAESPSPAAVPKYYAAVGGAPAPARVASSAPAPPAAKEEPPKDDDGFQTVPDKKGVWRPRRGRA
ncbi:hypothetical protein B0H14DRAFT_3434928 [Mycena olivaceomarginata]|nr:hypothetical protein B0H14DRAFT_3434928 [Mycena olivaceomarginata]